jgi:ADP-ribosylglycohydrolase
MCGGEGKSGEGKNFLKLMIREVDINQTEKVARSFAGVLLGTAAGDALGLPAEGLSPGRIRRLWKREWRMRFLFGKGMVSDDTEHTLMVAQAIISHPNDPAAFQKSLGWKLRWWFACLPAGVGFATARACLKLWMGFPASKAGVNSAGSGPAMRSAIIGAYYSDDQIRRREYVSASSNLTHCSWQADVSALAVAECVALAARKGGQPSKSEVLEVLCSLSTEGEWQVALGKIEKCLAAGQSVSEFACAFGLEKGVAGYALQVVAVALYAWMRHPGDYRTALTAALDCGGDTDTVGAVLGAMTGSVTGKQGIPKEWLDNIADWPRSVLFMEKVADRLANQKNSQSAGNEVALFWPAILFRNVIFLCVVLFHGFRRIFPPY